MAQPPTVLAQTASSAVHDLAHRTRPAITTPTVSNLHTTASALVELTAALPQVLTQLSCYPHPGPCPETQDPAHQARAALHRAAATARHLGGRGTGRRPSPRPPRQEQPNQHKGVSFQPAIRGQDSAVVDTRELWTAPQLAAYLGHGCASGSMRPPSGRGRVSSSA